MSQESVQRIYLTCGTVFLLVFAFANAIGIVTLASGSYVELLIAVILLVASMAVLLLNATMLFASSGGPYVLTAARVLLWLSFAMVAPAIVLVIIAMARSF